MNSLALLVAKLREDFAITAPLEGHRDVPGVKKACPSFNVAKWAKTGTVSLN